MPMRLGDVGRRYAARQSPASDEEDAILGGRIEPDLEVVRHFGPAPVPAPAIPEEIEVLRQHLREASFEFAGETRRRDALLQTRERAHAETIAAFTAVEDAEEALKEGKKFGRPHSRPPSRA